MIVSWMTTNRCNLKCEHCYQDAAECDSRELTTAEGKAMIEQIARAGFSYQLQRRPALMRDDIFGSWRTLRLKACAPCSAATAR